MKIFVAGARGLVGSAICRELQKNPQLQVQAPSSDYLDLTDRAATFRFFSEVRPEQVYLAAARAGGILDHIGNPVDYLLDNLKIQNNVIEAAHTCGVKKLLFLGSACIYPKLAAVPIVEGALLGGQLEPSNRGYAIAKIAGIELCNAFRREYGADFISVMPTNLYGIGDTYDEMRSHVLPAMIRRFHRAKKDGLDSVTLWGTGNPTREFLWSDDLARACVFLMENYSSEEIINVGSRKETALWFLAAMIKEAVGFKGKIEWDSTRPDGTPRRLLDSSKIFDMGWKPTVDLMSGIQLAYLDYLKRYE